MSKENDLDGEFYLAITLGILAVDEVATLSEELDAKFTQVGIHDVGREHSGLLVHLQPCNECAVVPSTPAQVSLLQCSSTSICTGVTIL